jgi:rhomboid family protein
VRRSGRGADVRTGWQQGAGEPGEPGGSGGPVMPQLALPSLTPVTKRLLIANGVVFGVWLLLYVASDQLVLGRLLPLLGLTPSLWRAWFPFVPVWQLFTYGFLHDPTSLGHIAGNMLVLYFFGTMLEGLIGSRRFVATYFGAQLAGALLFLAPGLVTGSAVPALGASGAVYGVMIACATLRPRQTVFLLFIPITMSVLALGILAITLFGLLMQIKSGGMGDGVAHLVHLGGIAYGFGAVKLGWIWRDPIQLVLARRAIAAEERRAGDSAEMDRLLGKIHREGMSALTRRERAFLKRVSSRR